MEEIAKKRMLGQRPGSEAENAPKLRRAKKTAGKKCRKEFGGTEPDHRTLNNSMDTW
jgi:hypothetical protein